MNFSVSTIPISQVGWPNSIIWCIQIGNIEIYRGVRFVYMDLRSIVVTCSVPARTCSFWRTSEISWSLEPRARNLQAASEIVELQNDFLESDTHHKLRKSWPWLNKFQSSSELDLRFSSVHSWPDMLAGVYPPKDVLPEVWCQWWWCDLFPGDEGVGFMWLSPMIFEVGTRDDVMCVYSAKSSYWMAIVGFQTILLCMCMTLHETFPLSDNLEGSTQIDTLKPAGFFSKWHKAPKFRNYFSKAYRTAALQFVCCVFRHGELIKQEASKVNLSTLYQAVLKQSTVGLTERDLRTVLKQAFL